MNVNIASTQLSVLTWMLAIGAVAAGSGAAYGQDFHDSH
jgi:hypothetical protein